MHSFPIRIIDFEASSLDVDSYPVEIGICIWENAQSAPKLWSSLIAPTEEWNALNSWDPVSEAVHGISRRQLVNAPPARTVARKANDLLRGDVPVWCDGGQYDAHWLGTLFRSAGMTPSFKIGDLWLPLRLNRHKANLLADWLAKEPIVHRAGADTLRLMRGLAFIANLQIGDSVVLD